MKEANTLGADKVFSEIMTACPPSVDLTNSEHLLLELIIKIVDSLLETNPERKNLEQIEQELIDKKDNSLIFILLALKIAKSKLIVRSIDKACKVSVVFAMYKEHNRIKKSSEHPHGEDFLRRKVSQLRWLFSDAPNFDWELLVVDDGCPEGSGKFAQEIIDSEQLGDKVKVLFLEDAIQQKFPVSASLSSTRDSQKGGAILYGMWHAAREAPADNHVIVFTDADLSTHLGQTGLLLESLVSGDKEVAIGSRREKTSVVIKQGTRNNRGKLFIYLWKRLLPELSEMVDTQCGFKAFNRSIVQEIVEDMIEKKFAFDIELLLKSELAKSGSIEKVPVAWIDSEAASTTTDLQPYLSMLNAIVRMYQKYLPANDTSDQFAAFIQSLDETEFNKLVDNVPEGIVSREPLEFNEFDEISAAELEQIIR